MATGFKLQSRESSNIPRQSEGTEESGNAVTQQDFLSPAERLEAKYNKVTLDVGEAP